MQHPQRQYTKTRKFAPDAIIYPLNGRAAFQPIAGRALPVIHKQSELEYDYGINETRVIAARYMRATEGHSDGEIEQAKEIRESDYILEREFRIGKFYAEEKKKVDTKKDWCPYRLTQLEEKLEQIRPAADRARQLRADATPRIWGLANELRKLRKLDQRAKRFKLKAQRQIACQLFGQRWDGDNCGCSYYRAFRCKLRYCPNCGPFNHTILLGKYSKLREPINTFLAANSAYRLRVMDITAAKKGTRMPSPDDIKKFKRDVKKLVRRIEEHIAERFGWKLTKELIGYLYCLEFGGSNNNLHCHGILLSPYVEHDWLCQEWKKIRKDGSFVVWIEEAKATRDESAFDAALGHALKYSGKYAGMDENGDVSPERNVQLEIAFDTVRRVSTLGWFYKRLPKDEEEGTANQIPCPCGKPDSVLHPNWDLGWIGILELQELGIRNLDEVIAAKPRGREAAIEILSPHLVAIA